MVLKKRIKIVLVSFIYVRKVKLISWTKHMTIDYEYSFDMVCITPHTIIPKTYENYILVL
jgi:hypothetical protein